MRVLAIDPGNKKSAWVVWDNDTQCIHGKGYEDNDVVLARFMGIDHDDFPKHEAMAIEMVASFGMAVGKEVFETVWWIGRFCQISIAEFHRVYRMQVKMHLCGQARAKDANIRQAIIDKLGPPGTKKQPGITYGVSGDLWSALAVALTFCSSEDFPCPAPNGGANATSPTPKPCTTTNPPTAAARTAATRRSSRATSNGSTATAANAE